MFSNSLVALNHACYAFGCRILKRVEKARAWPEAEFFIENVPDEIWGEVGDNLGEAKLEVSEVRAFAKSRSSLNCPGFRKRLT